MSDANTLPDDAFTRLEAEPPVPGRERVATPATWFLVGLLGLGGAFVGGAWWGRANPKAKTIAAATPTQVRAAPTGAATGVAAVTTAPATAAASTTGVIKLIDGRNVYIATAAGQTIKLVLAADAKVNVAKPGAVTDLTTGATVTYAGSPNADGTVAATSITAA